MTTNYRALCAELLDELDLWSSWHDAPDLKARTKAALAQLAPEEPTDEDLENLAEVMNVSGNPVPVMRRALELWGCQ